MRSALSISLTILVGTFSCSGRKLPQDFEKGLSKAGYCRGFIYSGNADHSILLVVEAKPGWASRGRQTFSMSTAKRPAAYVEIGNVPAEAFCSADAVGETDVQARYQFKAGKARVSLEKGLWGDFKVNLSIRNAELVREIEPHAASVELIQVSSN